MAKKRIHRPEGFQPLESREPPHPNARKKAVLDQPAGPSSRRLRFERVSTPTLRALQRLPVFVLPVVLGLLLFLGLSLPPDWTGILVLIIPLFLVWLTALAWPTISIRSRIIRAVVAVVLVTLGVLKLLGRL